MVRFGFQLHEGESSFEDENLDVSDEGLMEDVAEIPIHLPTNQEEDIDLPPQEEESDNPQRSWNWNPISSYRRTNAPDDEDGDRDHRKDPEPPQDQSPEPQDPPGNILAQIYHHQDTTTSTTTSLQEYPPSTTITNTTGAPVHHYHIYYQPPTPTPETLCCGTRCGSLGVLLSLVILFLSHVVYQYGPSVPPPHHKSLSNPPTTTLESSLNLPETWQDVRKDQADRLVDLASSWWTLATYVSFWCWQGLKYDYWEAKRKSSDESAQSPTFCHARSLWEVDGGIEDLPLFGQDHILRRLESALPLLPLDHPHPPSSAETLPFTRQYLGGPRFLYATGGAGVGKQHLARLLAEDYSLVPMPECPSSSSKAPLQGDSVSPLFHWDMEAEMLLIEPIEGWNQEERIDQAIEEVFKRLVLLLSQHMVDYPKGTVFLVSHATNQPSHIRFLQKLLEWLFSPSSEASSLSSMLVVLTSSIGSSAIDKAIRRYGGKDSLPLPELESYLRHQMVEDLLGVAGDHHQTSPPSSPFVWLSHLLEHTVVLPFLPLDKDAMSRILRHRLSTFTTFSSGESNMAMEISIETSESTLEYLLDHGLEWETWIHKTSRQEILSHVPNGGWEIQRLLDRLFPRQCLEAMRAFRSGSPGHPHPKEQPQGYQDPFSGFFWLTIGTTNPHKGGDFRLLACETTDEQVNIAGEPDSDCQPVCNFQL